MIAPVLFDQGQDGLGQFFDRDVRVHGVAENTLERSLSGLAEQRVHLGSPVAASDAAGNVLWRERYTPYGEKLDDPAAQRDGSSGVGPR